MRRAEQVPAGFWNAFHRTGGNRVRTHSMRIANVIEEGKLGGPQVRIAMVAHALKERAQTTVIMPMENSEQFRQRCDALGVVYETLPLSRITREWRAALRYVLFSIVEVVRLTAVLKRGAFDLVHVSGGSWQYKGVIAGKLAGKKVLWHLNDTAMPGFIKRVFSVVSRLADGFIYASERTRQYYRPLMTTGSPEYVIPAPVDTSLLDPSGSYPGDEELLKKWSGKFVVGVIANINPIKGLDVLIRTAADLNRRTGGVCYVVVGAIYPAQRSYFEQLVRLCKELSVSNIEFVGSRDDVRPLLKRFDAYVCSSRAESSPIAVWEAMAMGKPVVSTDVGDVPLYVRDGNNGFIVGVGDSAALADRLARLAADEELRRQFGGRGRDIVVRELDVAKCADRHIEAYAAMLAHD
jgi:glycosyltransferase involved in cell wall biosynthesis